jgi:hypothetical protein
LENEALTSYEIGLKTQKRTNYVNAYLFRLRKYGLTDKNDYSWFLTEEGVRISSLLKFAINDYIKIYYTNNTTTTQQQHNNNTKVQKKAFQVSIQAWLRETCPAEAEKVVVDTLVAHFNKTGSKFLLFKDHYAMSDMLNINVNEIGDVLAKLRQENIIYLMRDPTSGMWKLGLKKAFLEALKKQ